MQGEVQLFGLPYARTPDRNVDARVNALSACVNSPYFGGPAGCASMLSLDTRSPAPRSSFFLLIAGDIFDCTRRREGKSQRRSSDVAHYHARTTWRNAASNVTWEPANGRDSRSGSTDSMIVFPTTLLMHPYDVGCGARLQLALVGTAGSKVKVIAGPRVCVAAHSSCNKP